MEKIHLESMHYCYLTTKNILGLKKIQWKWTFKFVNSYLFGPPYHALTLMLMKHQGIQHGLEHNFILWNRKLEIRFNFITHMIKH
jgi:hypothetical protein